MGAAPVWHEGKKFEPGVGFITPGKDYWYVILGPIPGKPKWHEQSRYSSYPYPSLATATRFAQSHKRIEPERDILIDYPDGRRWDGKRFVA